MIYEHFKTCTLPHIQVRTEMTSELINSEQITKNNYVIYASKFATLAVELRAHFFTFIITYMRISLCPQRDTRK